MRAGKEIFRNAADDMKLLRLELGGKAPFIVAEDADIGAAVRAAVLSRFENCGQICICNERMYVHEKIADEFLEKFTRAVKGLKVGDPTKIVDVGPKFSGPELAKVERMVAEAVAAGAEGADRRAAADRRRIRARLLVRADRADGRPTTACRSCRTRYSGRSCR